MSTLTPDSPSPEVFWSISSIAERDQIAKQTVSEHVKRLADRHNLMVARDQRGRVALVNVVEYDMLRERYGDATKAQAPRREYDWDETARALQAPRDTLSKTSLEEAQRQKVWFDVEKRRLELAELRGQLIRADVHARAVDRCGAELARLIDNLPQEADAFAVELDSDDVHRVRLALKGVARRLRVKLSKAFTALQSGASATDEPIEDDGDTAEEIHGAIQTVPHDRGGTR